MTKHTDSRTRDDSVPDHPARTALLGLISRNPGITETRLSVMAEMSRGKARHHLRGLETERKVKRVPVGREVHFFISGLVDSDADLVARAQHGRSWMILGEVLGQPGVNQSELCKRVGMSRKTIRAKLDDLLVVGLIDERLDGRLHRYLPGPRLGATLHFADDGPDPGTAPTRSERGPRPPV